MAIDREAVFFEDRASLRSWLTDNHGQTVGIWAQFYKKSTGISDLSWEALVEECLCFGWIDSLPGMIDEQRTQVYIAPRKIDSGWSRRNKVLIEDLGRRGLLHSAGVAVIERAKANGSWTRFDMAESLTISPELERVFAADSRFTTAWGALTDSRKKQFLQQIYDAKTADTRLRRIDKVRQEICS